MDSEHMFNLLVIDDEIGITNSLYRQFHNEYIVHTANSAQEAIAIMEKNSIQIVISDQRMPEMTGLEFFSFIKDKYPNAIRIMISGYSDIEAIVGAINEGQVFKYITKPWKPEELSGVLKDAIEKYEIINKNKHDLDKMKHIAQRLKLSTESAHIGIWDFDLKNNILVWDKQMFDLYGIKQKDFGGAYEAWKKGVHPEDIERSNAEVQDAIAGKEEFHTQFRVVWPDGQIRHIEAHAVVISDSNGTPERMTGVNWDITDRKHADKKLLENQKRYQKAQALGHVGNWEYDHVTTQFWASDEAKRIYGLDVNNDAFTSEMVESCIPERERVHQALIDLIEHNKKYDLVFDLITKDKGIRKTIHSIAELEKDDKGNLKKITGVISDITIQRKAEEELIKAKERAEESDRLKSAFLANMSHEIRTPMNGILGFTNLLKKTDLSGEEQQKFINIIERSGDRMLNTINDIIDISKIESGQVDVFISDINLNKQLDELLEFFLPEAKKKNIQLSIINRLPDQQSNFRSDKEKLNSIFQNFIKNAIKYTPSGSISIGYSINHNGKQNELKFYVKDTGIGIPKERLDAIFNRFVQADIEDRQVYEGSGLGLAISKAYVEILGGKIWVNSDEGGGSEFYFTLPYTPVNEEIAIYSNTDYPNPQHLSKKLKILVVDDDEIVLTYLNTVLQDYKNNLLIAKTGFEAIEICQNTSDIDLILMDIKIPGIDGYEATRRIRGFNKKVTIIAQTAYAQSGDREKCIEAGCDDYISKPIDKEELLKIITKHM